MQHLTPRLNAGEYVLVTVDECSDVLRRSEVLGTFREAEGVTVMVERTVADALNISYDYVASWITLEVRSSLSAVGLTAAFSTALAKHDISCNVVAGYHHDHLFVDTSKAKQAVEVLKALSERDSASN